MYTEMTLDKEVIKGLAELFTIEYLMAKEGYSKGKRIFEVANLEKVEERE